MGRIRVALVINGRENWGRLKPLAQELDDWKALELWPICGGALGTRFPEVREDIVTVCGCIQRMLYHDVNGRELVTQAKSTGLAVLDYAQALHAAELDLAIMIGDRYETLAAAIAAATLHIPIVHIQGGEVSGSLDERYRHCISKLADWHVPATRRSADRLVQMGESPDAILAVGCPIADIACEIKYNTEPYVVAMLHPDTTADVAVNRYAMQSLLDALVEVGLKSYLFCPNIDAMSADMERAIGALKNPINLVLNKSLPIEQYLALLANAACCIGNSSSFVRDAGFFGTPVVLVGRRQDGREAGRNVVRVQGKEYLYSTAMADALYEQLRRGRYKPNDLYGKPGICAAIADAIVSREVHKTRKGSWYDADSLAATG